MCRVRKLLLDLGFLKFDVLAHDRIVFFESELLSLGAGILLCDIEEAGVGSRQKFNLERGGLGHFDDPWMQARAQVAPALNSSRKIRIETGKSRKEVERG